MNDPTEQLRRAMQAFVNTNAAEREALEQRHGQVWDIDEIRQDFDVIGFAAPLVLVSRKTDGKEGSLLFQQNPRIYWGFQADSA